MKKIYLPIVATAMTGMLLATSVSAATIQDLQNGKAQVQSEVETLQAQLTSVVKTIDKLETKLVKTGEKIEQTEKDLKIAEKKEKKQYADMKLRIQYMYEEGDASMFEELVENQSIADAMTQVEYISDVHSYDRKKMDEYIATKEEIADLKDDLEEKQASLKKDQKEFKSQKDELNQMIAERESTVANLDQMIAQAYAQVAAQQAAAAASKQASAGGYTSYSGSSSTSTGGTTSNTSSGSTGNSYLDKVLKAAYSYQGTAYKWGGSSKSGIDCSGLVMKAYQAAGISLPHYSGAIYSGGTTVKNAKAGYIVYTPGHVGIYVGNGQYINAVDEGDTVRVTKVPSNAKYVKY